MKIAFVWQGISERIYGVWNDGLRAAMRIIEEKHDVTYFEPWQDIEGFDLIMYWESPCTIEGPNSVHWKKVVENPTKKVLLFSGGPVKREWFFPFAHTFVESKINLDELQGWDLPVSTAFGINTDIFFPTNETKIYDGVHHGTCASWKRQWLLGEALGPRGLVFGRYQESDRRPFDECRERGTHVLDNQTAESAAKLLNQSKVLVQTSSFWGGGQRCTLEAMACGLPVIAMSDSPKNREYIEESFGNLVVDPEGPRIRLAVDDLIDNPRSNGNHAYVMSKWTHHHYAENLLKVIETL